MTTHSFQSAKNRFDTGDVRSWMSTVPETEYLLAELERRNISHRFGGLFLHDDTVTQVSYVEKVTEYLHQHAPWMIPIVNQVDGNSGPETLYRSKLYISSPEQYPVHGCVNGECQPGIPVTAETLKNKTAINATQMAASQQSANEDNAFYDMRFGLDHWPLFNVGGGNLPLHWTNGTNTTVDPDFGIPNVRSDSLVRWMAYSAVAFGAKALNWYCWSSVYHMQTCGCPYFPQPGGIGPRPVAIATSGRQTCGCNTSLPGMPSKIYQTAKEVNADASKWGTMLIEGGFSFASSYNSAGSWSADGQLVGDLGDSVPSTETLVTTMSEGLLATTFLTKVASSTAYVFVVSKDVSPYLAVVPARNVTLTLHPSVTAVEVVSPGMQGASGFDFDEAMPTRKLGMLRPHFAAVRHDENNVVTVTVSLVGGGGALLKLTGDATTMRDAAYGKVEAFFDPAGISLANDRSGGSKLKAPSWAYGTFAFGGLGQTGYMPLNDLELSSGQGFEQGEQTAFIIGGSLSGALTGPVEAKTWAWAGYNLLSMPMPGVDDTEGYGSQSKAFGDLLDWGFAYGYFGVLEAADGTVLSDQIIQGAVDNFRCHGRMGGLVLSANSSNLAAIAHAAKVLRTIARGPWLLPMAAAQSGVAAVALGNAGVPLAMPSVPALSASATVIAAAIVKDYATMYQQLRMDWRGTKDGNNVTHWKSHGKMVFVASLDACSYDSDSLLRLQAFGSIAFGARGVFWRGAGKCAGIGTDKFSLLKSINSRIKSWGDTFVASASAGPGGSPSGFNITKITTQDGWELPADSGVEKPAATGLVESMDPDVLVAELGAMGRYATPLIYVVNRAVSLERGGAPVRTIRVRLRGVAASQPLEGDCTAGACQCGAGIVGPDVVLDLPGGSGQLVALSMLNTTLLDPRGNTAL